MDLGDFSFALPNHTRARVCVCVCVRACVRACPFVCLSAPVFLPCVVKYFINDLFGTFSCPEWIMFVFDLDSHKQIQKLNFNIKIRDWHLQWLFEHLNFWRKKVGLYCYVLLESGMYLVCNTNFSLQATLKKIVDDRLLIEFSFGGQRL